MWLSGLLDPNARREALRLALLLALLAVSPIAPATGSVERSAILEAARTVASQRAGQAVRLRVDRLNQDKGWAVLVGALVGNKGADIRWDKVEGCHPDLDKMLWVVLKRTGPTWKVRHMEICASEPPYWYLEQYGGWVWPCGVYAGLESGEGPDLEQQCRANRRSTSHPN